MSKRNQKSKKPSIPQPARKGVRQLDKKLFRNITISQRIDRLEKWAQETEGDFKRATARMVMNMGFSLNALVELLIAENVILRERLEQVRVCIIREEHAKEQAKMLAQIEAEKAKLAAQEQAKKEEEEAKDDPLGRNSPCPCGSGKKYKKCCMEPRSEPEPAQDHAGDAPPPPEASEPTIAAPAPVEAPAVTGVPTPDAPILSGT